MNAIFERLKEPSTNAILERLKEPSTWSALGGLALAGGIAADDWVQYSAFGAAMVSFVLGVVFKEMGAQTK